MQSIQLFSMNTQGLKDWSMSLVEVSDTMTVGGLSVSNVSFLLIQKYVNPVLLSGYF